MSLRSWMARGLVAAGRRLGAPAPRPSAYAGGRIDRGDPDFDPLLMGPNLKAQLYGRRLRNRSRELCDDHDLIRGARETWINEVGTHYLEPNTGDPELNESLATLFWKSAEAIDAGREDSLFDLQELALSELFAVGEVLSYFPVLPEWRGIKPSVGVELVDTDLLPLDSIAELFAGPGDQRVRQGVEFDSMGRRVAYHVLSEHPADGYLGFAQGDTLRISAMDANLMVIRRRPKQIRGVPWPVAVVRTTRMEDAYHEANIFLARVAAYAGVVYTGVRPPDFNQAVDYPVDSRGNPVEDLEPGSQTYLPDGAKAELLGGNTPGPTFKSTMEVLQNRMAAGLGMSYTSLTRDSSKATFAAQRADSLADRKSWRKRQKMLAQHLTLRWWERRVKFAITSGELQLTPQQLDLYRKDPKAVCEASVVFDGWEWVNPSQEATADRTAWEMGVASRPELISRRGRHPDEIIAEEVQYELRRQRAWADAGLGTPPAATASPAPAAPADSPEDQDVDEGAKPPADERETNRPNPPRGRLSGTRRVLTHA